MSTTSDARTAFASGLTEITDDKRVQDRYLKRFDSPAGRVGTLSDHAHTLYREVSTQSDDPDRSYTKAVAVYDDATGGIPLSDRDTKRHPGKHRVKTGDFVDEEYNPFKKKTNGRLQSHDAALRELEAIVRRLLVREIPNTVTRAEVIKLRQEFDDVKRGYVRVDTASSTDDPAITAFIDSRGKTLDERLVALAKFASDLNEATDRDVAAVKAQVDDQETMLLEHDEQLEQLDTMVREHDAVVAQVKSGIDNTGHAALMALIIGAVAGVIAFVIKLLIHEPDVVVRKETVRGVSIEQIIPSPFNGLWPAVVTGLIVGLIVFLVVYIIGLVATNRHNQTDDSEIPTKKRYHFFEHSKAKEESKQRAQQPAPDDTSEPDGIEALGLSEGDTAPTQAHA